MNRKLIAIFTGISLAVLLGGCYPKLEDPSTWEACVLAEQEEEGEFLGIKTSEAETDWNCGGHDIEALTASLPAGLDLNSVTFVNLDGDTAMLRGTAAGQPVTFNATLESE
jgi:hypothetical protein